MNRNTWKWLLAVSVSLNVGFAATVLYKHFRMPSVPLSIQSKPISLPDQLQLTGEQRSRWHQMELGFIADLGANWHEIEQRREVLIRQIFSTQPDREKIDVEQAKIAALQEAQQRRVITQLLGERELLDQRQRAVLMALLLSRYENEATKEELLHRDQ